MNFSQSKENIQPLAAGRNVEQLEVALNAESHHECQVELLQQRKQFEQDIRNYVGDDPLDLWFEYVSWVEQSYPKSGKEAALDDLLKNCLSIFEKDSRYAQDARLVRLFIKYIDTKNNPHLYYTKMYNGGIGTMIADLYIAWAHYFDIMDDFDQAKKIYQKGLDARAAPIEQLKQIYERFQFSVGQRIIHKEEYRQEFLTTMEAQRNAFTSLRSLKRSKVGSIRTGSAVKSFTPGQVRQSHPMSTLLTSNAPLTVYKETHETTEKSQPSSRYRSVVEEIEHSSVENKIEPGPWSKASSRKSVFDNVHRNSTLKLAVFEDDIEQPSIKFGPLPPDNGNLAINLPPGFAPKNEQPQKPFDIPAYVEDVIELKTIPCYPKFHTHPNEHICFQLEEVRVYARLKRQNISNQFTKEKEKYWGIGNTVKARILPNFPRKNQPQSDMETERPDISSIPSHEHFVVDLTEIYPNDSKTDVSLEEIAREKRINNSNGAGGMDETVCVRGRQSFGVSHIRKSIASSSRKSIMPVANDRGLRGHYNPPPSIDDSGSDMELDDGYEFNNRKDKVSAVASADKDSELPKSKWSIYTDDEPKTLQTPSVLQKSSKQEQSAATILPVSESNVVGIVDSSDKSKEIFAVPQRPISRPVSSAEKRTVESVAMKCYDIETSSKVLENSPFPIGPHTGAVKKIIRKSSITENAIQYPGSHNVMSSFNNNEIPVKSPLSDLDYSLCTQAFNKNLAEQMVSTPVSTRRTEPLCEPFRVHDTQPPQPLKLSTIMETTEGSTHTTGTKSSTQFSSPEDDDLSKRSNVTIRTKFAGGIVGSDNDTSGGRQNDSKSESIKECLIDLFTDVTAGANNHSHNVEQTLPAIQMSLLPLLASKNEVNTATAAASTDVPAKDAPIEDVPASKYPFPIFEDTQTTTIASMSSNRGSHRSTTTDTALGPIAFTAHPMQPSTNDLQNSIHSNNDRFNMSSMWIKDEPQSLTLIDSIAEESFAIPNVRDSESLAEPNRMMADETENNFENVTLNQPEREPHMDGSMSEESFAIPNTRRRQTLAPPQRTTGESHMDSSMADETFALPSTRQNEFSAQPSYADKSFELDDSSDSEEEIIEVPDETLIEDSPKIVDVQSLANRNGMAENHFEMSTRISISLTEEEMAAKHNERVGLRNVNECGAGDIPLSEAGQNDQSIYFKQNSILVEPLWTENKVELDLADGNVYQHEKVDLEESRIVIETKLAEAAVNPFDEKLKNAILSEAKFMDLLETDGSTELIGTVPTVAVKRNIKFKDSYFDVVKCIGHGAFGRVYTVKYAKNQTIYAAKKEMPANIWEYYILDQVRQRVARNVLLGYMRIDMAIIGNDASLLFSEYSSHGTLLDVCNRVFTSIQNNVNETIVFILAYQMLNLIDHLHKADILHLDLKPDNFLVMRPMSKNHEDLFIQLIDFGNAVDLRKFPLGQEFTAVLETKHFVCIEMLENRPWIFQPDLYCLAATIHSVLFGRYMEVRKVGENYVANFKIPRYFNGDVWTRFFNELMNVPANTSPDLQKLKNNFHEAIVSDKKLEQKILEFNRFII